MRNTGSARPEAGPAPLEVRRLIRRLSVAGALVVLVLAVLGVGVLRAGNDGGWSLLLVAAILTVFWGTLLPAVRRHGKA